METIGNTTCPLAGTVNGSDALLAEESDPVSSPGNEKVPTMGPLPTALEHPGALLDHPVIHTL